MTGPSARTERPPHRHSAPRRALRRWLREPPDDPDGDERSDRVWVDVAAHKAQLRSMIGVQLLVIGCFIALGLLRGQRWAVVIHTCVVLCLVVLDLAIRRLGPEQRPLRHVEINMVLVYLDVLLISMITGQNASVAAWFLVVPPILAYTERLRSTLIWTAVAASSICAIEVSSRLYPIEPEFLPGPSDMLPGRLAVLAALFWFAMIARRRHNAQLARLAESERINRQQAASLAVARDEALEAARVKGRFLATMSHELRTPLNGVIGIAELLQGSFLDENQRHLTGLLQQSGRTLLRVINDILDFSKLEERQFTLKPAPLDLYALVADVAEVMRATVPRDRPVMLKVERDPRAPRWIVSDEMRLRQVLLNLVGNATKFTPTGSVIVGVGALQDGHISFFVRDTGIGIAAADHARLFEPFTQADGSDARRFSGTGLGLAIARRLVELMGGTIGVESEPGVGSTFRFDIQAESAAEPVDAVGPESGRASSTAMALDEAAAPGELAAALPLAILVVEDNPVNQTVIVGLLGRLGYHADLAIDGNHALEASAAHAYDAIFMDVQLPGLDGLEVTRRIRARPAGPRRPAIIALTANVMPEQIQQCEEAGMDAFLTKPFTPAELVAVLRVAVSGATPLRMSRTPSGPVLVPPTSVDEAIATGRLAVLRDLVPDASAWGALIGGHLDNSGELMQRIRRAHAEGDAVELERAAHSLASSSAMFGALRVSQACRRIESEARAGAGHVSESTLAELEAAYGEARAELVAVKAGAEPAPGVERGPTVERA